MRRASVMTLLALSFAAAASVKGAETRSMKHVIVSGEPGRFSGWPANNGVWMWGNEIAVAFSYGYYESKGDEHSISRTRPSVIAIGRSRDGGETWTIEEHPELGNSKATPSPGGINFAHPDFALRCNSGHFHFSYDRGKSWQGPLSLGDFALGRKLTSRSDYLVNGKDDAMVFLSAEVEGIQAGNYKDRAFCTRTTDGGKSFQFVSWINDEPRSIRGVMLPL